jgi:hypothetical protein
MTRITIDQLATLRDYVRAEVATLPRPPCDWVKFFAQVDLLKARLESRVEARFRDRPAGSVEVEIGGIRASSTMGAAAALSAWLRKVDRHLAMESEKAVAHG